MEGDFACPECGTIIEVEGQSPGRQARCPFCDRLLEVPFFPRSATTHGWKRKRFQRPKWVPYAWAALALAVIGVALAGGLRFAKKQRISAHERSLRRLLDASVRHENLGELGPAVTELDAAIELARGTEDTRPDWLAEQRERRRRLVHREVEKSIEQLLPRHGPTYPLGEWLTLVARTKQDEDLTPLAERVRQEFQRSVHQRISEELLGARKLQGAGDVVNAFEACDRIAALFKHLAPSAEAACRTETEALAKEIIVRHGVDVFPFRGTFAKGSASAYTAELMPQLIAALESKGYLPNRDASPWRALWKSAPYTVGLEILERFDGTYLSSQNQLTRIDAVLDVIRRDPATQIFQVRPTARSAVPLPGISSYVASRIAANHDRNDEIEKMLAADAHTRIVERLRHSFSSIPPWQHAITH
jgi:hypothetical protein